MYVYLNNSFQLLHYKHKRYDMYVGRYMYNIMYYIRMDRTSCGGI